MPALSELKRAIPSHCFASNARVSLAYAAHDVALAAAAALRSAFPHLVHCATHDDASPSVRVFVRNARNYCAKHVVADDAGYVVM